MGCSGHIFFAAPSPLSLLLFRLVVVSISSGWLGFDFFFCFLGEVAGAATAGVFGVALEDLGGDAAGAEVTGVGVAVVGVAGAGVGVAGAGVGVAGGSGVAATATVADDGPFF